MHSSPMSLGCAKLTVKANEEKTFPPIIKDVFKLDVVVLACQGVHFQEIPPPFFLIFCIYFYWR